MGLLLGNCFEREDTHVSFSGVISKILLDKISQGRPDFREVTKWRMEGAQGYRGGVRPFTEGGPAAAQEGRGEKSTHVLGPLCSL